MTVRRPAVAPFGVARRAVPRALLLRDGDARLQPVRRAQVERDPALVLLRVPDDPRVRPLRCGPRRDDVGELLVLEPERARLQPAVQPRARQPRGEVAPVLAGHDRAGAVVRAGGDDVQAQVDQLGARGADPLVPRRGARLDQRDGAGLRREPAHDVRAGGLRQLAEHIGQRHEVRFRRRRGRVDEPAPPLRVPDGGARGALGQPLAEPDRAGDLLQHGALRQRRPDGRGRPDRRPGAPADVDLRTRLEAGRARSGFGEHSVYGGVGRGHPVAGVRGDVDLGAEDRRSRRVTLAVARAEPVDGLRQPRHGVPGQLFVERGGEVVGEYRHDS